MFEIEPTEASKKRYRQTQGSILQGSPSSSVMNQLSSTSYQRRVLHLDGLWKTHDRVKDLAEQACPGCEVVSCRNGLRIINVDQFGAI